MLAELVRGVRSSASQRRIEGSNPTLEDAKSLITKGDFAGAESKLRRAVQAGSRSAGVHRLFGSVLGASGRTDEARSALERSLELEPNNVSALADLGNVYRVSSRLADAARCYRRAIALDPDHRASHLGLALIDEQLGRVDDAIGALQALLRPPALGPALEALVALLDRLGRVEEARQVCHEVLRREANHGTAHAALGFLLLKRDLQADAALVHLDRALQSGHRDAEALSNRGIALQDMGRLSEALDSYDAALELEPDHHSARFHRSLARLLQRDFAHGWPEYETRLLSEDSAQSPIRLPRWNGDAMPSSTLLVHGEQGIGDEIMFASCLPELLARCPNVVLICADKLEPIFRRSFPTIDVIGSTRARALNGQAPLNRAVAAMPIGSLPLHFRSSLAQFPKHGGYLTADAELTAQYRARLQALGPGPKVGLSWRGGSARSRQAMRTLEASQIEKILAVPGIRFVNLQYDSAEHEGEIRDVVSAGRLIHWPEALGDYQRTAALVCALDVVASVCTALIHLSGALGRPVWIMTPFSPEWRYGIAGEDMPWYPSAVIMRQRSRGDWPGVVDSMCERLRALAA